MEHSTTINKMALPNPDPTNWTLLGVVWATVLGIISVLFKWIDSSFKARREEREAFITAVVDRAMSSSMQGMKEDIRQLFEYRELDRQHIDEKFSKIMLELKK